VPIARLAVLGILHLQPLRPRGVVPPVLPLRDDPLEVLRADSGEELAAAGGEMLRAEDDAGAIRHDRAENLLAIYERELSKVLAVRGQDIERDEREGSAPVHEVDKARPALSVELYDFSVEHSIIGIDLERELRAEILKAAVLKVSTANQFRAAAVNVGDCTEAIVFQLEEPVGVIKRLAGVHERHGRVSKCGPPGVHACFGLQSNDQLTVAVEEVYAVLFDQESVVERARDVMARAEVAARCATEPGSFFEAVPAGGDVYILKSILRNWDDERSVAILKGCRGAMRPGSKLLIVERERAFRVIMNARSPVR
jgi:hypothetical protein